MDFSVTPVKSDMQVCVTAPGLLDGTDLLIGLHEASILS